MEPGRTARGEVDGDERCAGDGTTTATLLAQAIVREGLKNVAAGANPIVDGIETAIDAVVKNMKVASKEVIGQGGGDRPRGAGDQQALRA